MSKSIHFQVAAAIAFLCLAIITPNTTTAQKPDFPEGIPIIERPFTDDPDKFTFAIIGDKTGGGLDKWHIFDRAIDEINALKPDFAIMMGDLIQGDTTDLKQIAIEWNEFWEHQADLEVLFLTIPGNHDITNPVMYDYWKKHIGQTYSAFTYKNCLFLMLNTEEWHANSGEWTNWFGMKQIEYVKTQLTKHKDVRHTFVFLHRPLWLQKNSGWEEIETALGERAYTVFAGHYHKLTLHKRNDRRYFVLGATGAGFTPQTIREVGAFDHYSLVTVDNDDVNVAIIEPGNIYPADLSTAAFKNKVSKLLTFQPQFTFKTDQTFSDGTLEITLNNTLKKDVDVDVAFESNKIWQITPNRLSIQAKPGKTTRTIVTLTVPSKTFLPFPIYNYSMLYGGEQLSSGRSLFHPIDREFMHVLKNWMLLGPFDLGLNKSPADPNEVPLNFLNIQVPKLNLEKTYQGKIERINWKESNAEQDRIKLDAAFGNVEMAYGFGITFIKSPDSRKVFAQIGWGSNLGRIYLNGQEIQDAAIPNKHIYSWWAHFELPLQKGWNTLTVLSGDYNGWWDYRMEIADPANVLQFSLNPTNTD